MSDRIGSSMAFHPHSKPFAMCHTYGTHRTPILTLQDDHAALTISARENAPLAAQLKFARELASAAAAYAAAVEIYAAAHRDTEAA